MNLSFLVPVTEMELDLLALIVVGKKRQPDSKSWYCINLTGILCTI